MLTKHKAKLSALLVPRQCTQSYSKPQAFQGNLFVATNQLAIQGYGARIDCGAYLLYGIKLFGSRKLRGLATVQKHFGRLNFGNLVVNWQINQTFMPHKFCIHCLKNYAWKDQRETVCYISHIASTWNLECCIAVRMVNMLSMTLMIQRPYMVDSGYYRELCVTKELVRFAVFFHLNS